MVSIQCCDVGGRGLWLIDKWAEAPVGGGSERVWLGKQKVCHDRMEKERKRNRKIWKSEDNDPADLRLVTWIHLFFLVNIYVWLQHMENSELIQNGLSFIFIDVLMVCLVLKWKLFKSSLLVFIQISALRIQSACICARKPHVCFINGPTVKCQSLLCNCAL